MRNVTLLWHPSTWSVDFSNGRPVRVLVNSNSKSCVKWAMYRSYTVLPHMGFPGGSDGRVRLQCRRPAFDPWVGKIPWRRKWQPSPGLLPGKSHGRRSLVGYSPSGCKESDTTERLHFLLSLNSNIKSILPRFFFKELSTLNLFLCWISLNIT